MILLVAFALPVAPLLADDHDPAKTAESPQARQSVTEHSIRIDGERVDYTATVGWMIMEEDDKPIARFGYTAYQRKGDYGPAERPIVFAFNGGPGSSSLWRLESGSSFANDTPSRHSFPRSCSSAPSRVPMW